MIKLELSRCRYPYFDEGMSDHTYNPDYNEIDLPLLVK